MIQAIIKCKGESLQAANLSHKFRVKAAKERLEATFKASEDAPHVSKLELCGDRMHGFAKLSFHKM